ncbi:MULTISPECIES: cell division protein FtsL [unclassified Virgibacillus]|uniref:cell division protein FtsL n=1 Tax=unclassified Virgibacillus TaxID=2620237 RepID=UPI0024DEFF89|nr:cell division protein FtsL [Virgibacillus sp. LDC-1]
MAANHARSWEQSYTVQTPQQDKQKVIIRKAGWITKGEKILYSVVAIILVVAATLVVSFSSSTDALNRELQSLEKTVQTQQLSNEHLQYEVKELSEPERIIKIAKENGLKIQNATVKQAASFHN